MKKKVLSNMLIIVFGVSFLYAQPSRLDSVIAKSRNDTRAFEEFILLGKMECYCVVMGLEKTAFDNTRMELYADIYAILFNSLTPFTRLFEEDSIYTTIKEYLSRNKKQFDKNNLKETIFDKKKSHYYKNIKLCDHLFSKNKDYKKQYLKLIRNKNNHITPTNDNNADSWDEKTVKTIQKNYLEHYFIKNIIDDVHEYP